MDLRKACLAFADGFAQVKALHGPYTHVPREEAILLFDPRGTRVSELICPDLPPAKAIELFPSDQRGGLSAIYPPDVDLEPYRREFRAAGWRLTRTEGFFYHALKDIRPSDGRVRRIRSAEEVIRVAKAMRRQPETMGIEDRDDAPMRFYEAVVDGENAGFVRSVRTVTGDGWVSGLFVRPEYRRQGLGAALMNALLADDARLGFQTSILLASHAGARLYPTLGYERIGTLMLLMPIKKAA